MKFGTKVEASVLLLVTLQHFARSEEFFNKCPEFNPQNELDIELISGLWFGAEMITHYEGRTGYQQVFDSCVIVQIDEINEWGDYNYDYDEKSIKNTRRIDFGPSRYRFIKLAWNEQDKSAEYVLKFNGTKRGLWIGTEPPRGSSLRKNLQHGHFTGTVQVMKAVGNHLVLTFCERTELFTIILTRTRNVFAVDDVESVHALLGRRGLAVQAVRELCRHNSGNRVTIHTAIVFSLVMMLIGMGN